MWKMSVGPQPSWRRRAGRAALASAALVGLALLAGCGGSAAGGATHSNAGPQQPSNVTYGQAGSASTGSSSTGKTTSQQPAQYLVKSLSVSMAMPDPRASAKSLESWILTTDPKAQSSGSTYSQDGDQYDVNLSFTVQASIYPQIKDYLTAYAEGHKGTLVRQQESVQDLTSDYVDSQSRLANLRVEQGRLQTLMSQAGSMNDVLTVEQRLSDVEGQIEQIEAHLSQISGETTYYTVQLQLTPLSTYVPPVTQPWNPGVIFHEALDSAKVFGEGLLTLFIWLAVYSVYIIPVGLIIWLVTRYMRRRGERVAPTASGSATPPAV